MDEAVIPECYVDTALVETVAPPQKRGGQQGYNHQKGCGTVARTMQKNFGGRFALGIIDRDKQEVDYLNELTEAIDAGEPIPHKHKTKPHYVIQIRPAIQRFILANADAADISLERFGLPTDFEELKRVAKKKNSKDHRNSGLCSRRFAKAVHQDLVCRESG